MANFRYGAGIVQDKQGSFQKLLEFYQKDSEATRTVPTGQRWDNLSVKMDTICSGSKHVRFVYKKVSKMFFYPSVTTTVSYKCCIHVT